MRLRNGRKSYINSNKTKLATIYLNSIQLLAFSTQNPHKTNPQNNNHNKINWPSKSTKRTPIIY